MQQISQHMCWACRLGTLLSRYDLNRVAQTTADKDLLVLQSFARETARFRSEGCNDEDPFAGLSGSEQEDDEATIEDV